MIPAVCIGGPMAGKTLPYVGQVVMSCPLDGADVRAPDVPNDPIVPESSHKTMFTYEAHSLETKDGGHIIVWVPQSDCPITELVKNYVQNNQGKIVLP